jgi:6-phosphofructokinase 1
VLEVMGRNCGYLALISSILGGAEIVVTPERPISMEEVAAALEDAYMRGKSHAIAVVAEGAPYRVTELQDFLTHQTSVGFEIRVTILGHTQRGGSPTAFDRLLATRMGVKAVQSLMAGETGKMVALNGRKLDLIPLEEAISQLRPISESYFEMARYLSR